MAAGAATVSHGEVRWSKDGRALYWTTDLDSEFRRLARHDLAGGAAMVLTASIPWNVEAFDLADDGRTIALAANEDGISRLHVLDARTGAERGAPTLPAGQVSALRFRKGSRELGFSLSTAILTEAALSFLGLGTPPSVPSWGSMLSASRRYVELDPWPAIFPGLAIMLLVLGFNLFGDGLRDVLDPRLRAGD